MSNTLSLATRLGAMSDAELAEAIRTRGIGNTGIKDFFDLAEAFLDSASVQRALSRLDRRSLAVLAAIAALEERGTAPTAPDVGALLTSLGADALSAGANSAEWIADHVANASGLLLLDVAASSGGDTAPDRFVEYDPVRAQLIAWPASGLPSLDDLASTPPPVAPEIPVEPDQQFVDRLGAERAFAAASAVTELLGELEHEPARELAKGGLSLPDSKRLAAAMSVELEAVVSFFALADRSGLVAREAGSRMVTELGASWLLQSTGGRWAALTDAWLLRLPGDIRSVLTGRTHDDLRGFIDWLYPLGGDWMDERISAFTRDAELLGLTANQASTGPGMLLFTNGIADAQAAMTALLPPEVEQVYLQHDLSIVAPGPLTPQVDSRLRAIADVESRALASSYRLSVASVNRAMATGETAESMLEFLGGISLTGIPQPIDYLIAEVSARYGQVRVGSINDPGTDARSYVRSDDELQIGTILVDQSLTSLGLELVTPGRATSRYPIDVVFWSISDARYSVAAEDSVGEIVALRRRRAAKSGPAKSVDPIDSLIERLRLGAPQEVEETGQAWLVRQLDVAIKAKAELIVSVTMPNGNVVDYQLEPTSVGGGRLRGRDNRAAIERTLPLSRVVGIAPARSS